MKMRRAAAGAGCLQQTQKKASFSSKNLTDDHCFIYILFHLYISIYIYILYNIIYMLGNQDKLTIGGLLEQDQGQAQNSASSLTSKQLVAQCSNI